MLEHLTSEKKQDRSQRQLEALTTGEADDDGTGLSLARVRSVQPN